MRIAALDISESSCGYAIWSPDDQMVNSGAWVLGSALTPAEHSWIKTQNHLEDIHAVTPIDALFYEMPLGLAEDNSRSNPTTRFLLIGLAASARMWAHYRSCRIIRGVHQAQWRREFLGAEPFRHQGMSKAKKQVLGIGKVDWKQLAVDRSKQLGFKPRTHDEAEAIGVLDYACTAINIIPPWRANEVLRPPLGFEK